MMSRPGVLSRAVLVAVLLFGGAILVAYHFDYSRAETLRMLLICTISLGGLLGATWLLQEATHDTDAVSESESDTKGEQGVDVIRYGRLARNIGLVCLAGMWIVALAVATPTAIPLYCLYSVGGSFAVAFFWRRFIENLWARIGANEVERHRRWTMVSALVGVLFVAATASFALNAVLMNPRFAVVCGILAFVSISSNF
jgi:hypothetical protein